MFDKLEAGSEMSALVERNRDFSSREQTHGDFYIEQWRNGEIINIIPFPNGATSAGKQYMLGAAFLGTPAEVSTWYFGLIDGTSGTPVLSNFDTMVSHGGWSEFTYYDETTRQGWSKAIDNSSNSVLSTAPAQFTVSSGVPINALVSGAFVTTVNTKSGTTGVLWAHGLFPTAVPVQATDIFKLNYNTGL